MLDTVLFDMGGTLEDIYYNAETIDCAASRAIEMLHARGLDPLSNAIAFWNQLNVGFMEYKRWSEANALEKKPEEIWNDYYLRPFGFDRAVIADMAEELAGMWEVSYFARKLRPGVPELLETLRQRGFKLGIISNTCSLYSVFDVLEQYGIRDYFQDVTLSSITGYRKPHPQIFSIALRQLQSVPENCVYVGDTRSRDIMGAKRAGFGCAVQIQSFLTEQKDAALEADESTPDHIIHDFSELVPYLDECRRTMA